MASLQAVCINSADPAHLARFWAGVLNWEMVDDPSDCIALLPSDDTGYWIRVLLAPTPKDGPNRMHFDLTTTSSADQQQMVARALELGGRHIDIGQTPDEGHIVLADPEDNEFCVIEPGNNFLAGCGLIGALNWDGSQAVGYFWSEALGWPLVWDQDEETAIQSPGGGSKIAWGGPPVLPKPGPTNRLYFDLTSPVDGGQQAEVERLEGLGATCIGVRQGDVGWTVMADPDGNEFCVLPADRQQSG